MNTAQRRIGFRKLHPVGLGCMSLSQAYYPLPDRADALGLLHRSLDLGYDHWDTARLYGLGHNESLLSEVLQTRRDEVFLASKCGIEVDENGRRIDCRPETIRKAVETSLSALNVEYIDLYYLHRRDFNVPIEESVGALKRLIDEGKIGAIGLSEMSAKTLRAAASEHYIAALQSEYSLWTRNPELGALQACREIGTAFVAFSPLARGALTGAMVPPGGMDERDLRTKHPRFSENCWPINSELMAEFAIIANELSTPPSQLALAWLLSRGDHVHVIPGTSSLAHLAENYAAVELQFPTDAYERIEQLVNQDTVAGHRYPEAMRKTIDTEEFPAP